jgi:hypothetical protein
MIVGGAKDGYYMNLEPVQRGYRRSALVEQRGQPPGRAPDYINMQCLGRAERYMLFLRTLDQSTGIAGRKTRIIASEDAICVDGMVVNRMRGAIMWRRLRGQSGDARRSGATGQSRRRCEDAREVFPDGRSDARATV